MRDFYQFDQELYPADTRVQRLRLKKRNYRKMFLMAVVFLLVIGVGLYSGYNYGEAARQFVAGKLNGIFEEEPVRATEKGIAPAVKKKVDPTRNILILGVDQRKNEPSRSDTIMVLMLNPETKKAHFISLPRDTRVEVKGYSYKTKLNHAHAAGGIELATKTIEKLLDLEIHNYLETNFTGFENIIDILGGVEMDVEKRMYYPQEDINIKKGKQKLNGHKALGYVRFRSDGLGDLGRIERQQKFLKSLIEQHLKLGTILKMPEIIGELKENIETDLSMSELLSMTNKLRSMDGENVKYHQLPGKPDYVRGASYYIVNEEGLQGLLAQIRTDLASDESSKVEMQDGSVEAE